MHHQKRTMKSTSATRNPATKQYHIRMIRLGTAHLLVGLLALLSGVLDVTISSVAPDVFYLGNVASGIWVGFVFMLTGGVGISTSRSEMRKKMVTFLFLLLSLLCGALAIAMIVLSLLDLLNSQYQQGFMDGSKQTEECEKLMENGTVNMNLQLLNQTNVTCISTVTFNQKKATTGVLIGMAFVESFIVYHSIVVTVDIIRKLKYKLCSGGNSSTDGERRGGGSNNGELPGISVEQYYSEIMMAEEQLKQNGSRKGKIRTVSSRDFSDINGHSSLHGTSRHMPTNSITLRDFPDFDKFGAHLEDVEMNASPQKG